MTRLVLVFILVSSSGLAQLAPDQKLLDFQHLAALYAKHYAPYEWKRDALKFDMYNLTPWLDRVRRSTDDLGFYEIVAQYVASLNDAHSAYFLPSDFVANLGFVVDLYDGRPLVDTISRSQLPVREYPFEVGDELVSIDGKTPRELLAEYARLSAFANSRSTDRYNAILMTRRIQSVLPRAPEIGESAQVAIRRAAGGVETYSIPWMKEGLPLSIVGPVPSPRITAAPNRIPDVSEPSPTEAEPAPETPSYMEPWLRMRNLEVTGHRNVRGLGELAPVFALPAGFVRRLGRAGDLFYSGTYDSGGKRIGYIRIPTFDTQSVSVGFAFRQFDAEITYMRENTGGLVVDVMRNLGGDACYVEELARRLVPYRFQGLSEEIRVTRDWILSYSAALEDARASNAENHIIVLYGEILKALQSAYRENRGRTGAIPICEPYFERDPVAMAYDKPLIVLTDEFSTSAAEAFAGLLQDSRRGPIVGMRTAGAGGSVLPDGFPAGFYSEGWALVTETLLLRQNPIVTPDYPAAPYIENIGVRPDKVLDYMTEENLRNQGRPFVQAFTDVLLEGLR